MARLKSDLTVLVEHAVDGTLDKIEAEWDRRTALGVVLAAEGYPEKPKKGDVIDNIPDDSDDMIVFHAGTAFNEQGQVVTNGGRVLCVVGLGDSVKMARLSAYRLADLIRFSGKQLRRDIGNKALAKRA
jgi:phosphoribosylamine--glycine ligase